MTWRLQALGAPVDETSVSSIYGKEEVLGFVHYPSSYCTNEDLYNLYLGILPAMDCPKKRTEVARLISLQPKMSLSLRLEHRKAFVEVLDQICRKSNCKPMCARVMCPDCTPLSTIRWVLFQDVEQVYTGNFLPNVRTFIVAQNSTFVSTISFPIFERRKALKLQISLRLCYLPASKLSIEANQPPSENASNRFFSS